MTEVTSLDMEPLWITLQLASITVLILLLVSAPLAWWLAFTRSRLKIPMESVTALPLVLPPTVLGFYLLVFMGANGAGGQFWTAMTGHPLAFSFVGLVFASCIYSLPFVVQPLQAAFEGMDRRAVEAAWTLGASRSRTFIQIVIPQVRRGLLTAVVLGFAHTLGEFGVILMVGGSIPGETKVASIAVFELVESLNYRDAWRLSLALMVISYIILLGVNFINSRERS